MSSSFRNFATCHSHPQSLDSASTPEAFLERELELQSGAITCTDHGTLVAARKIYDLAHDKKATKGQKITPILGLEGYLRDDACPILTAAGIPKKFYEPGSKEAALYPNGTYREYIKYHHVTMHALDQTAFECMVRMLSKADERSERHGSERKPLFTWANLEELGSYNITMTTGCLIGVVQRHMLDHNDLKMARAYYEKLKSCVKPGNLYVEVFPHKCDKNWVSGVFLEMADSTTLKYYAGKLLRTSHGEIHANDLAKMYTRGDQRQQLLGVSNSRVWQDLPPVDIIDVKHVEDFLPNECRPWAPDGDVQRGLNRVMLALANAYGDKVLIGDDSHFAHPEEKIVQDVRLAQNGNWRFAGSYHRQSSAEAYQHFRSTLGTPEAQFESWVVNSHEWAERFKDFTFHTEVSLPTKFYEVKYCEHPWHQKPEIPKKDHSLMYTMELIKKHGRMDWKNKLYVARLQAEIKLLHNNGTIDLLPYFFLDEETCSLYEQHGLLTGPGRGSAAGLLLTYLLGITHVDPIKHELSMDRFLTVDRIRSGKLPDIDQDLPSRDLLCDPETGWLKQRFGDHYAQLSVDTTLKLRSAVKDTARHLHTRVPEDIEGWTRKFTEPPQGLNDHDFVVGYDSEEGYVKGSSEPGHSGTDVALVEYIKRYPKDWSVVQKCLGLARQKSRHPCAFVIANKPIHEFIPLTTVSDVRVTSYTAASVEAVGGLKMDFLVVNSLNDIGDCIKLIQQRDGGAFKERVIDRKRVPALRQVPIAAGVVELSPKREIDSPEWAEAVAIADIWDLPEDPDVFADIATGKTETVFQYNTPAAIQWLHHFGERREDGSYPIDSIQAMAAFTALDRPGPLDIMVLDPDGDGRKRHNMLVEYARRARGATPSPDVLEVFDRLIPETYGVMVYQEQLQKLYQQLTGCSGPDAEEFRTNVAKKKKEKVDAAYPGFIANAGAKIGEANAKAAWEFFKTWAQYGFNKSHAVCYATIGYACAFLKHHYPLEWWTSVLKNAAKNEVNEKFWRHCGHLIDLPDVVSSGDVFEIQNERIRAPLSLLKGVGEAAHHQLNLYRPYVDIEDFVRKQEKHCIDNGVMVTKTKTVKKKVADPAGGKKKVTVEVEETIQSLKRGYSALNRKVVYTLILSGAMDSLFSKTAVDSMGQENPVLVSDQLQMYEMALAAVKSETAPLKKDGTRKKIKVESVAPEYVHVSALRRFQMRKAILPAYAEDLQQLLLDGGTSGLSVQSRDVFDERTDEVQTKDLPFFTWSPPDGSRTMDLRLISCQELERLQYSEIERGSRLYVAVPAYIEGSNVFSYVREEKRKTACKLQVDIDGGKFEFVRWPDKTGGIPEQFKQPLDGTIAILCMSKYTTDKPFALEDVTVVQQALDHKDETTTNPPEGESEGESE